MIRSFRLALAQMNPTVGDIDGNTARIIEYVERAQECGADLVAFPELAITGYPPEDLLFKTSFLQANEAAMQRVVAAAQDIAVVVGYVEVGDSATGADIANAAAVGYNGKLIDSYRKMYLPTTGYSTRTATSGGGPTARYTALTAWAWASTSARISGTRWGPSPCSGRLEPS